MPYFFKNNLLLLFTLAAFPLGIIAQELSNQKATVYFIRPNQYMGSVNLFKVIVNDTNTVKLVNNSYYPMQLNPGVMSFRSWKSKWNDTLTLEAGKTYYVMAFYSNGTWTTYTELIVIDENRGKLLLSKKNAKDLRKPLIRNKSRVGVFFAAGPGFNEIPILMTTEGDDVTIGFSGGFAFGLELGTEISQHLDLALGYRYMSRGLSPYLENASMSVTQHVVSLTPSLIIPIQGGYAQRIKVGLGADYYLGTTLEIQTGKIPGGINDTWKYKEAAGYRARIVYESTIYDRFTSIIGIEYYGVTHEFKSSNAYVPLTDLKRPKGNGLDFRIGFFFNF